MPTKSKHSPEAYARALEKERDRKRAIRAVSRELDYEYYRQAMLDPVKRKKKSESTQRSVKKLRDTEPQAYLDRLAKQKEQKRVARQGENREHILALQRASKDRNPEKRKATHDAWRKKNWDRLLNVHNGYWQKRRALLANAEGSFNQTDWDLIVDRQNGECFDCKQKRKMTIGHLVPLSKGGNNWPSNIVAQCQRCNSIQGSKIHPSVKKG